MFQRLVRAAYRRPGSEQTRTTVLVLLDEFDFLVPAPPPAGDWRTVIPANSPTPAFGRAVAHLIYGDHSDRAALVKWLAEADGKQWEQVWTRWQAIAAASGGQGRGRAGAG